MPEAVNDLVRRNQLTKMGSDFAVPVAKNREMLRVYRAYRETGVFEALQRYGAARARAVGVRDEGDVDRLVQEARGV